MMNPVRLKLNEFVWINRFRDDLQCEQKFFHAQKQKEENNFAFPKNKLIPHIVSTAL